MQSVRRDIQNLKILNDLLDGAGIRAGGLDEHGYHKIKSLIEEIEDSFPDRDSEDRHHTTDREAFPEELSWFFQWFKETPTIEDNMNHLIQWRLNSAFTCFLGDADNLVLKPDFIGEVIEAVREAFPTIQRFTIYGRTRTAAEIRTLPELSEYRRVGLDRVHFGVESGSDTVLKFIQKGVSKQQQIDGLIKTRESGLSCSVYVMPGLGGTDWSQEHARETADVISQASPDYVRLRTLCVFPGTPLWNAQKNGDFTESDDTTTVREIRDMIEQIDTETELLSDSASNLLPINGVLPRDRDAMILIADQYLDLPEREKRVFALESRINAFMGQYGGLTQDIYRSIAPYVKDGTVDFTDMPDNEIEKSTVFVRSKLMP